MVDKEFEKMIETRKIQDQKNKELRAANKAKREMALKANLDKPLLDPAEFLYLVKLINKIQPSPSKSLIGPDDVERTPH